MRVLCVMWGSLLVATSFTLSQQERGTKQSKIVRYVKQHDNFKVSFAPSSLPGVKKEL